MVGKYLRQNFEVKMALRMEDYVKLLLIFIDGHRRENFSFRFLYWRQSNVISAG